MANQRFKKPKKPNKVRLLLLLILLVLITYLWMHAEGITLSLFGVKD